MDAVKTYRSLTSVSEELNRLLDKERILFCCYSRLLAIIWVRSELGRLAAVQEEIGDRLLGSVTTEAEALERLEEQPPTLLLSTQLLEEGSGLTLVQRAKERIPGLRSLLFLQHNNLPVVEQALGTQSDGILLEKHMGSGHAMEALRTISRGGFYFDPDLAAQVVGSRRRYDLQLSPRELEVMQQVVFGLNDRDVGEQLHLTVNTVKTHLKEVYQKLGVHNRTRAAIALLLMGLVSAPKPLLPDHHERRRPGLNR
jgi:DNA-binding NarL/FixJ family response regulator